MLDGFRIPVEALVILYALYIVPALFLFGGTAIVALFSSRPTLFVVEYVSWLVPGITYWFLYDAMNLNQAFRIKTLGNLIEPCVVAVVAWYLFSVRLIVGARWPRTNRVAAWLYIAASNLAPFLVLALMPTMPE